MINQVQRGEALTIAAPSGGFTSGSAYLVGPGIFGVAAITVTVGVLGVLWTHGVYTLSKTSAQAWVVGDILYWDTTNLVLTNVSGAGPRVGVAIVAAANPSSTGVCRLDGFPGSGIGGRMASGQHTTAAAADTVVTGLTTVVGVVASFDSDEVIGDAWVTATIGNQSGAPAAGSIIIKTWQATSVSNPTPIAATAFSKVVNWIAFGT